MAIAMDNAGAMIIGSALVMLFSRLMLALIRVRDIEDIRTQHFSEEAIAKRSPMAAARRRLVAAWNEIPARLRVGAFIGLTGLLVPMLLPMADGPVGNACVVAGKWLVLGGLLTSARQWGIGKVKQGVRGATERGGGSAAAASEGKKKNS